VFAENVTRAAIERDAGDCATMGYKAEMLTLGAADLGAEFRAAVDDYLEGNK
jgi:hypothetical protein